MSEVAPLLIDATPSLAKQILIGFDRDRIELYNFIEPRHRKSYVDFWYNPKQTPQQICDEAWNKAYLIFKLSSETQDLLEVLNPYIDEDHPWYVRLGVPEWCEDTTINADGTVTVVDNRPPVAPPEPLPTPDPTQKAPKLERPAEWKGEGINPEFAVLEEDPNPNT